MIKNVAITILLLYVAYLLIDRANARKKVAGLQLSYDRAVERINQYDNAEV